MRCSLCETLIDRYIEGTLPPARMQAVRAHLDACPQCEAIHRELRTVDGMLATTRSVELPPNFTFAVMAEARAMPAPAPRRSAFWLSLAVYLFAGWLVAAVGIAIAAGNAPALAHGIMPPLRSAWSGVAAMVSALHVVGPVAPIAASVVVAILCADAMLIAAVVYFYRRLRPQLAARYAVVDREGS